jgi:hypothetical protein
MGKGGGSQPTTQTVQQSNIPEYARPYFEDIMTRGQAASQVQYQPYTGERIAPFSPMQQQAFQGISQLGPSPLLGTAAGLTGLGAQQAAQAGQYNPLTAGGAGAYMSPYMQNVVDIQTREAQRQADIARTERQARATGMGAFGGSRQAIMEAEAARNLAQQKGDIQAQGQQAAFQAAEQSRQFGAGLGMQGVQQLLGAAGQLGQLGQTAYGQQVGALQAQQQAGAQQQAQAQQMRDLGYEEFMRQQYYPQSQLQFLSSLLRGSVVAPQQTMYTYQQAPSLASQLGGIGMGMYGLSKMKEGGEVKSYALGGVTEGAFASNISKLVKLGLSNPALIDRDRTATPLEKQLAKAEVMRMRQAFSNQQALDRGIPSEEPILSAGVGSLDTPEFTAAEGGIVAFQHGGTSEATAKYQQAMSQSFPMEFGRRLGAGIADFIALPGQFAWEIDPATGKLRKKHAREGYFPISRDIADKGAGIEAGYAQQAADIATRRKLARQQFQTEQGTPVVDQIPGQSSPPAPAGIDFAKQGMRSPMLSDQIAAAAKQMGATPPGAVPPGGIGDLVPRAPAVSAVPDLNKLVAPYVSEQQRLISAAETDAQRMPTREQTEASYREKVTKDLPYNVADQLKSLTTEGQEAIKQRDSDRWLAVAVGGFEAAAGESPHALQNFAKGLGLTAKEFRVINKDFQAAEKERRKMRIALQQQARAEELGLRKDAVAAGDRADTARRAVQDRVDRMRTNLLNAQIALDITGEKMRQEERLTRAKIAAQGAATREVRLAREARTKDALHARFNDQLRNEVAARQKFFKNVTRDESEIRAEAARDLLQNPAFRDLQQYYPEYMKGSTPGAGFDLSKWGKPSTVGGK